MSCLAAIALEVHPDVILQIGVELHEWRGYFTGEKMCAALICMEYPYMSMYFALTPFQHLIPSLHVGHSMLQSFVTNLSFMFGLRYSDVKMFMWHMGTLGYAVAMHEDNNNGNCAEFLLLKVHDRTLC